MHHIKSKSVNGLYNKALNLIDEHSVGQQSRNGPVLVLPAPVVTEWTEPWKRVLFAPTRDCNPFFHVMEFVWMMAGAKELSFLTQFVPGMANFSDDGESLNGAYGFRWRNHFRTDQLLHAIEELRINPESRRVVVAMWDAHGDHAGSMSKDIPCNTHLYFRVQGDYLDMTVCNRSNDIVWGAYGANSVHMSMLHELISYQIGVPMGTMYTWANNWHFYPNNFRLTSLLQDKVKDYNLYRTGELVKHVGVFNGKMLYHQVVAECERFVRSPAPDCEYFVSEFMETVVKPMYAVWNTRSYRPDAVGACNAIRATDWRIACKQWLTRRMEKENE